MLGSLAWTFLSLGVQIPASFQKKAVLFGAGSPSIGSLWWGRKGAVIAEEKVATGEEEEPVVAVVVRVDVVV